MSTESVTMSAKMSADEQLLDGQTFQLSVDSYYYEFLTYSENNCTCNETNENKEEFKSTEQLHEHCF